MLNHCVKRRQAGLQPQPERLAAVDSTRSRSPLQETQLQLQLQQRKIDYGASIHPGGKLGAPAANYVYANANST